MIEKELIILVIVLLILDLLWIRFVMGERYQKIFGEILKDKIKFNLFFAIFTYSVMIFALYYFVLKYSENSNDALIKGCLMGFVMYGVYDGTLYSFLPITDYTTGFLDVLWGIFVCGISSYIAFEFKN
jgi:uncharacterized membrane protein